MTITITPEQAFTVVCGAVFIYSAAKNFFFRRKINKFIKADFSLMNDRVGLLEEDTSAKVAEAGELYDWISQIEEKVAGFRNDPPVASSSGCKVDSDGTKRWRNKEGQFHRTDGPAIEWFNGSKSWYQNGQYHRTDGPAYVGFNGDKYWYIEGKSLTEEEFNNYTKKQVATVTGNTGAAYLNNRSHTPDDFQYPRPLPVKVKDWGFAYSRILHTDQNWDQRLSKTFHEAKEIRRLYAHSHPTSGHVIGYMKHVGGTLYMELFKGYDPQGNDGKGCNTYMLIDPKGLEYL